MSAAVDAKPVREVGDWDDDAATEADAVDVAGAHELVGGGAGDTEDGGRLLDGEGGWLDRTGGREDRHGY